MYINVSERIGVVIYYIKPEVRSIDVVSVVQDSKYHTFGK